MSDPGLIPLFCLPWGLAECVWWTFVEVLLSVVYLQSWCRQRCV